MTKDQVTIKELRAVVARLEARVVEQRNLIDEIAKQRDDSAENVKDVVKAFRDTLAGLELLLNGASSREHEIATDYYERMVERQKKKP